MSGYDNVPDGMIKAIRQETFNKLSAAKIMLEEVNETLTEMGWHSDRGMLYRIRKTLKQLKEIK